MSLDPDDYRLLQSITESLKRIHQEQQAMRDIAALQARKDFLMLACSPERVHAILREEYGNINNEYGCLSVESHIVAKI